MVNDVARAFFEAPGGRVVCVELPPEARKPGLDEVGLLQKSLYGTRDASANFQAEVRKFMVNCGFTPSAYNPCVFFHRARGIRTLVHGDDFVSVCSRGNAAWFKGQLEKRFEIKSAVLGTGPGEALEGRILNRVIRVTSEGWEYEADQRHAELIIKGLGLQTANGVKTPGQDQRQWEEEDNMRPLLAGEASNYRALAARANYLALDRPDVQFAAKEVCRGMARPNRGDMQLLRRLGRYLISSPRVVWHFQWQVSPTEVRAYSDSDWAGCRRTARSTSGGVIMRGSHCLRTYSVTQKNITLSSAEAELMALVLSLIHI